MHALKFVEAGALRVVQMEGVNLNSPTCQKCLVNFQESMRIVSGIAAAPGWAAMVTLQYNMATNNAAIEVWGIDFIEKMNGASGEKVKRFENRKQEIMKQIVEEESPLRHDHLKVMSHQLDELAWRSGEFVHSMMEGLLKAVWIQAWTVIEVLCEDLHSSVLDSHSNCFSSDVLEQRNRRLQDKKGKKFGFRSRESIRDAYNYAFTADSAINAAVQDASIDALASVRHLLVHKCGIVDAEFMKETPNAPLLKSFAQIEEGRSLKLDGEIVCRVVQAAANQGYALLRAIDDWLIKKHIEVLRSQSV